MHSSQARSSELGAELHVAAVRNEITEKVYRQLRKDMETAADAFTRGEGYAIIAAMAYLRSGDFDGRPFGSKRLTKFAKGFTDYTRSVSLDHVKASEMAEELKEDIGWDVVETFKQIEKEKREQMENEKQGKKEKAC